MMEDGAQAGLLIDGARHQVGASGEGLPLGWSKAGLGRDAAGKMGAHRIGAVVVSEDQVGRRR